MKNKETTRFRRGYWDGYSGLRPLHSWDDYAEGYSQGVLARYKKNAYYDNN